MTHSLRRCVIATLSCVIGHWETKLEHESPKCLASDLMKLFGVNRCNAMQRDAGPLLPMGVAFLALRSKL